MKTTQISMIEIDANSIDAKIIKTFKAHCDTINVQDNWFTIAKDTLWTLLQMTYSDKSDHFKTLEEKLKYQNVVKDILTLPSHYIIFNTKESL